MLFVENMFLKLIIENKFDKTEQWVFLSQVSILYVINSRDKYLNLLYIYV